MQGAGSMAAFARYVDFGVARLVGAADGIVISAQICRMASRAFEVPVLLQPSPVQRVAGLNRLVRVEMKPSLPAVRFRPRIPGYGQSLEPPTWKLQKILLE